MFGKSSEFLKSFGMVWSVFFLGILLLNSLFAMSSLLSIGMHLGFPFINESFDFHEFFHFLLQFILLSVAGEYSDDTTFRNTHMNFYIEGFSCNSLLINLGHGQLDWPATL